MFRARVLVSGAALSAPCLVWASFGRGRSVCDAPDSSQTLPSPKLPNLNQDSVVNTAFLAAQRSLRTLRVCSRISLDYKLSLYGLESGTEEYDKVLEEVHERTAERLKWLCVSNGGTYVKAGQFIASAQGVPRVVQDHLRQLCDDSVQTSLPDVLQVIQQEGLSELLGDFDVEPVGTASLAQVHKATLLATGDRVAVKVQHPHLRWSVASDLFTVDCVLAMVELAFKDARLRWLMPIFRDGISHELDFTAEAQNARICAINFRNTPWVHVPAVYDQATTRRVLTMEFVEGCKIDDTASLIASGINPTKVADMYANIFAEMIFCHGFVHCDPHPGNILVRVAPRLKSKLQVVILDHGLYRALDPGVRQKYAGLWIAMILQDRAGIDAGCTALGMAKYKTLLPIILTGRLPGTNTRLSSKMSKEQLDELRREIQTSTGSKNTHPNLADLTAFIESLPQDLLFVLRAQALVRRVHELLGGNASVRLTGYARAAARALPQNTSHTIQDLTRTGHPSVRQMAAALVHRLVQAWGSLSFEIRLWALQVAVQFQTWRKFSPPL
eukprot:c13325_g1_i1.p1 GENE.c13325_g1_i1~~c13325_g1_i1.p1  ORF type:complete len:556 (+),score=110.12 c13325_g1_i1:234-1901(+)